MIIVELMGGLGNQMFQYAIGRHLAHRHRTELKLDHTFLELSKNVTTPRHYELDNLSVLCRRAGRLDLSAVIQHGYKGLNRWIMPFMSLERKILYSRRVKRERFFQFDPDILAAPDNIYLEGYWQSEKYFKDISEILRKEFQNRNSLSGDNLRIANDINNCCSVSLHIRRGDYVSDQKTADFHGLCSLKYYNSAIKMLVEELPNLHFFVFSDDIVWAKANLKLEHPVTFVDHNAVDQGHEDLRLMSLCRHHIIANSSFSWWGAWLNPRSDKIVIAPDRWFRDPAIDTRDLIPSSWRRINP